MMVTGSLSAHPCFKTLDPESCRILDRCCTLLKAAAGAWIVDRTANDGNFYFVMAGRLRPALHGMPQDLKSSEIERASFFGELGAVEGLPRRHGVSAVSASTVTATPAGVLVTMVLIRRPLGQAVLARPVTRNRATTRRVGEAVHIYEGRRPFVCPMRSRPPYGRFHAGVGVRHIGPKQRRT
jgi:CRP-like cAMP-binding protein